MIVWMFLDGARRKSLYLLSVSPSDCSHLLCARREWKEKEERGEKEPNFQLQCLSHYSFVSCRLQFSFWLFVSSIIFVWISFCELSILRKTRGTYIHTHTIKNENILRWTIIFSFIDSMCPFSFLSLSFTPFLSPPPSLCLSVDRYFVAVNQNFI